MLLWAQATSIFLRLLPALGCTKRERPGAIRGREGRRGGGGERGWGRRGEGVCFRTDVVYVSVSQSAVSLLTLILLPHIPQPCCSSELEARLLNSVAPSCGTQSSTSSTYACVMVEDPSPLWHLWIQQTQSSCSGLWCETELAGVTLRTRQVANRTTWC